MKRSLLTGLDFFLPFPDRGTSVHISLTFSRTMLQCRSNALTLPRSFLLFRQLMSTCVLFFTDCVNTDSGPVLNSSSSRLASSSGVISDLGLFNTPAMVVSKMRLDENLREIQGLRLIPASWLRRFQNVAALPDCLLVYVEPSKWFTLFSLLPLIRQYVTYTYCRLQVVWAWNW